MYAGQCQLDTSSRAEPTHYSNGFFLLLTSLALDESHVCMYFWARFFFSGAEQQRPTNLDDNLKSSLLQKVRLTTGSQLFSQLDATHPNCSGFDGPGGATALSVWTADAAAAETRLTQQWPLWVPRTSTLRASSMVRHSAIAASLCLETLDGLGGATALALRPLQETTTNTPVAVMSA
eukprot:TRINITY_DN52631_c0_g2_i1.p1 TRINITY_DN52631_c0_g2~~TRINITY_DN52631_c0_g2_i1.p1  ORF type:complete len:178 (-),score=10.30 TRINITY_DN52631_c0_g2_i1:186-719(-)